MTDRNESPLSFGPAMARAIFDGRKRQTRRLFTAGNSRIDGKAGTSAPTLWRSLDWSGATLAGAGLSVPVQGGTASVTPRWATGDVLYVREVVAALPGGGWAYAADGASLPPGVPRWRTARFMPRAAARALLTLTAVRIERLQDISEADAQAEGALRLRASGRFTTAPGAQYFGDAHHTARAWFRDLWTNLRGADAWDANPWIAALTFTTARIEA